MSEQLRYWRSRSVPACVVVSTDDYSQTRDELIPASKPCPAHPPGTSERGALGAGHTALTRVRELEAFLGRAHAILRDLVAMKETLGHYDFAVLDGLVERARAEDVARGAKGGDDSG